MLLLCITLYYQWVSHLSRSAHSILTQSGDSLKLQPQVMFYPAVSGSQTGL